MLCEHGNIAPCVECYVEPLKAENEALRRDIAELEYLDSEAARGADALRDKMETVEAENLALRARVAEYEALTDELDATTRRCYLSGPTVVNQFKRLRQQAAESEKAGGEQ